MNNKQSLSGPALILLSGVCFGSYGIWSKMMAGSMGDFFQGWTRSLMILAILFIPAIKTRAWTPFTRAELPWMLLYSIPGSLVIPLYYYGFTTLPIGTATLSFYAALTLTGYILGTLLYKERITRRKILSFLLGIAGLVLVAGNALTLSMDSLLPLIVCVIAGMCGGTEVVITKKLSGRHSPIQLTGILFFVSFLLCLSIDLVLTGGKITFSYVPIAWIGNVGHAIASTAAFMLVVAGYKKTQAVIASIIGLMEIPFGILFGLILFNESITWSITLGMICIALASLLPVFSSSE